MEETTQVLEREERVSPGSTAKLIRNVRKATRRKFTAEDKIRIVLEGFRKEIPISDLCRKEKISSAIYYVRKLSIGELIEQFENSGEIAEGLKNARHMIKNSKKGEC